MHRLIVPAALTAVLLATAGWVGVPLAARGPDRPSARLLHAPVTVRQPLTPVPTPAKPLVGVYQAGAPGTWSPVAEFARATGVQPQIVEYYSPWRAPFAASFAETAWAHHADVLVELQPSDVTLSSIAAGASDAYLRAYAQAVVRFGHPVILSFGHEMNGNWYPWGAGHASPAAFVAAWRHVVDVFRAAGAANATWLWAVNSVSGASSALRQWWPGAAWVNWTGVDGYYFTAGSTFAAVLGSTIADIRAISSAPLLIAETAVGTTQDRVSQIDRLFADVRADHLAGVVWFDQAQHGGLYHQDWRLEDDPGALAAFSAAARAMTGPADGS